MNKTINLFLALSFSLLAFGTFAQQPFTIYFNHKVGNEVLQLMERSYSNSFGEPFIVNRFRYYVSNIHVTDINNKKTAINQYYLIDEADSNSKTIKLSVPNNRIKQIEFALGVDSIKNVSGVQTGNLDPAKGMFWTWNTGYVFAKLEGQSDSSHIASHYFTYHIGGYKPNENAIRKINFSIMNREWSNTFSINVDLLKWFDGNLKLKINENPVCHVPGKLAMQIADNYSQMFSIQQ